MRFYIGDMHFGHQNVIKFDNRPFKDWEQMDIELINRWNDVVKPEDEVYILGDFCCRNQKSEEWYLHRLNGTKHLVIGNHDGRLLRNKKAVECFGSIEKMMHIEDRGKHICLCHFPLAEWNGFYKGHWHIYGHIHNQKNEIYQFMKSRKKALNAGCMLHDYMPVSFDTLLQNNKAF